MSKRIPPPDSAQKVVVPLPMSSNRTVTWREFAPIEGSVGYLRRLAVENSSAFAALLGKCLPHTLSADESGGGLGVKMVFERHIVFPDGRREIEGVTPKALPPPTDGK